MKYAIDVWTVGTFIDVYERGAIDLQPPYQRNPVWTVTAQKKLLESILTGKPIPAFFLLQRSEGSYEMVDGQQRARTILGYWKGVLIDHESLTYRQRVQRLPESGRVSLLDYRLSITILSDLTEDESIEEYYALLNSAGLRLNRPELKKAEYFRTNFLKLAMECASDSEVQSLRLFTEASYRRMNEVDFVSELLATMKFGLSEKKDRVDELYEDDISENEFRRLRQAFQKQIEFWTTCNEITPIVRTRYKQKNDFYTLFHFFFLNRRRPLSLRHHWYNVLVKLGPHIRPSQAECEPLRLYAHHCVTQSNSRQARQARHDILSEVLIGQRDGASSAQEAIQRYFGLEQRDGLVKIAGITTLEPTRLKDPKNYELDFDQDVV